MDSVIISKTALVFLKGESAVALYRVLLVDDEEDIRVGISRKMDWAGLGFTLVGEAENGQEALELAEQNRPHVVLTDIKMPFMDGLSLCRILKQRLPASKFVVFSGFDEFEYAKKAIQMNVSEYILKPINAAELSAVLQRLREQLDAERAQRQNMDALRRRHEESLPLLRSMFFTHLLDGRIPAAEVPRRAARYEIAFTGSAWAAGLCHFDGNADDRRELLYLSLIELFQEHFDLAGCTCMPFLYSDCVALLFSMEGPPSMYKLIEELDRLCKLTNSLLCQALTVGVGVPCADPARLPLSAKGAREALDYRVLLGTGRGIYIGDLEAGSAGLSFDEEDERELTGAVKLGSQPDIRAVVDRLMEKIKAAGLALPQCHLFFLELLTCLLKLTRGAEMNPEDVFGEGFSGTVQITDFASPADLGSWCLACCLRIQEQIGRQRTDSAGRTVEMAKAFIRGHYKESELSVETLCTHLHLSPSYFSTIFKRETGLSFTSFVTEVRMEAAAELLRTTMEKTYLIAERIGYADPNYFSYVFKKRYGVSPTKFRAG